MPNWCFNYIDIKTKDAKTAEALFRDIEKWTSKEYVTSDFGEMWLGNILGNSGLDKDPAHSDIRCRGHIDDFSVQGDTVNIQTESAWGPAIAMWFMVVDELYPDSTVTYTAEETGCGLFWTNNKELTDKYIIDSCNEELESDWDGLTKEQLVKTLQEFLNTKETNVDKLISLADDEEVYVHQYEFVDDIDDL